MASVSLTTIDESFEKRSGPLVVPRLRHKSGGLDPLGLGQVNFGLMDEALPGINNVTTLVRPYSVMAWAWWKAAQLARETGRISVRVDVLRNYVERVDLIFVMSQLIRDADVELPGKRVLGKLLDLDTFDFDEATWQSRLHIRRTSTALMAPVQYGPSIRAQSGLGWLVPDPDSGALVPVEEVMPAILAVDKVLAGQLPAALCLLEEFEISRDEIEAIGDLWSADDATAAEKSIFRARFYGDGSKLSPARVKKRRATLDLMLAALKSLEAPATTDDVRKRMFDEPETWGMGEVLAPEVQRSQQVWVVLQLRQLQRLANESLFAFVEHTLQAADRPLSSSTLAAKAEVLAAADLGLSEESTLADALASGEDGNDVGKELFALIDKIKDAQKDEEHDRLPALALRAFRLVYGAVIRMQENDCPKELFGGDVDRLPLREFTKRIVARIDDRLRQFWREVIEVWVLGQHVRWAVARNGDDTQRLRVVLDEGGWVRMPRPVLSRFVPTQDRLHSALCLSELSGMVGLSDDRLWVSLGENSKTTNG